MTTNRTALVLGATGGVGGAITSVLLASGWSVRALVRDPAKAAAGWSGRGLAPAWIAGDAMTRADVVDAARGVDAIVHAVNPPGYQNWDRLVLPMMENTLAAARAAGGARIVLPGTIYNFDPARVPVVDADSPQMPRSRKGAIRVRLEQLLEAAAPAVPSLIVRAGDFFGPDAGSSWFAQALVTPGRPVRRLLNPANGPGHSWAYLPDLAQAIGRLMDAAERLDPVERVQFEGYVDVTGAGMVDALRAAIGRPVPVYGFPWWAMRLLSPLGGMPREMAEIAPYWRHPLRLDNRRLVTLIGTEPRTPLTAAVETTLAALGCLDAPVAGH
ncbi:MAG: NAD(P)H-binding protein [Alphaproteobacteria bacterium]|nr:NAD(P)H-binding protein [Alphaproteobacteria bacterium]MBU1516775.1 NAD(P)H-binding protein [Alphaproteobacteria bacterium]MBU2092469.1 NAD(P)H-binding protein [Alphaproteobacteria bacterium]MBU2152400.1 NAD(P)H-binding protein [Alphaproteobacteria bacterium]MBU2305611.1 NAD(P)H-binding protein [Alphaproteobacteria bacterium]